MTREATNAFLKACEEPLPNRVIIATTSNKGKILDTILSRAIAIACSPLSEQEMATYISDKGINIASNEIREFLIMMAMGRPGTLDAFYQQVSKDEQLEKDMQKLMQLLPYP